MNAMIKIIIATALMTGTILLNDQTKIIAHRGFSGIAPENTLIAFQKAIECRADYFELDVHKTKDDSLVVIHDGALERTSSNDMAGKVIEMTYSDLAAARVGYSEIFEERYKNERIPTLREVLKLAKGKIKVCIELKVLGIEKDVLKIIHETNMHDEVVVFSFYYQALAKIRQLDKDIPILHLVNHANNLTVDYAGIINANAIGVGYATKVNKELMDYAHENGIEVWKWTVNKKEEMEQLFDVGIDGLITNFPDKALEKRKQIN